MTAADIKSLAWAADELGIGVSTAWLLRRSYPKRSISWLCNC